MILKRSRRPPTEGEQADQDKRERDWQNALAQLSEDDRRAYDEALEQAILTNEATVLKAEAMFDQQNQRRIERELPPEPEIPLRVKISRTGLKELNPLEWAVAALSDSGRIYFEDLPEPVTPEYFYEMDEIFGHFKALRETLYGSKRLRRPTVNSILLLHADYNYSRDDDRLNQRFSRFWNGDHRIILGPLKVTQTAY
jgi:hypothetical protein